MVAIKLEIIAEILSRMPPKDAMKLSCVCKKWRNLLNSPSFPSLHLKNFTRMGGKRRLCKFTEIESQIDCFHVCDDGQPYEDTSTLLAACPCNVSARFTVVGIIDGVVCLAYQRMVGIESVYLWNPIVKRTVTIPTRYDLTASMIIDHHTIEVLGFGHDSATDDHKLFSIISQLETEAEIGGPTRFHVYSSKNREMAQVPLPDGFSFTLINRMHGAFLNGRCHWPVIRQRLHDRRCCVLSVSASDYSVRMQELPEAVSDRMARLSNVSAINGCLGIIPHDEIEGNFADVWVLREYDDTCSWMIRYRIERGEGPMPALMWRSGEIMDSDLTAFHECRGDNVQVLKLSNDDTEINRFAESFVFLHEGEPFRCPCNVEALQLHRMYSKLYEHLV